MAVKPKMRRAAPTTRGREWMEEEKRKDTMMRMRKAEAGAEWGRMTEEEYEDKRMMRAEKEGGRGRP